MKDEYFIEVKIKRREQNFFQEIDFFKGNLNDGLHFLIDKYGITRTKNKLVVINEKLGSWLYGKN